MNFLFGSEGLSWFCIAGLLVYMDILKRQQKYGDALKLVQGLTGDLLTIGIDRLRLQVCYVSFVLLLYCSTVVLLS